MAAEGLLAWDHGAVSPIWLSPRALAHYLPAYLRAVLTVPLDPTGFALLESLLTALTPPARYADDAARAAAMAGARSAQQRQTLEDAEAARFQRFTAALTPAQGAAVAATLEAVCPLFEDDAVPNRARAALDAYWIRFAAGA